MRISGVRATPLRHGCVTETGTSERQITAVIAAAGCGHFRLTLQGTIESGGRPNATATGAVEVKVSLRLPGRPALSKTARGQVSHGHWRLSLVLPGVNLDPLPPRYLIIVHYPGDSSTEPASDQRRIRIESEPPSL